MEQIRTTQKQHDQSDDFAVSFTFDELFFSRTDERGIILSGNSVFQRISLYTWEELINKPHNLIRHHDMPKAVFWLLWDTIKRGKPIGAYVKNRAKDGRYYWVFAIVTPVENGYLSVRLKPSSSIFKVVEQEYKNLRAVELGENLKAHESGSLLLNRLAELGFPDYSAFMATALSHEIAARDEALGRQKDMPLARLAELMASSKVLLEQAAIIFDAYSLNEYVPLNLRVQAAQLGDSGSTIGVISNNYNIISNEIKSNMDEFITSSEQVSKTIEDGAFLLGTAKIQREVMEFFSKESGDEGDNKREMVLLEEQQKAYAARAKDGLHHIARQVEKFQQSCMEMKRLASGLGVTRIMGKVESARLSVTRDGLNELIDDLETFQNTVTDGLKEIERVNSGIYYNLELLLKAKQTNN